MSGNAAGNSRIAHFPDNLLDRILDGHHAGDQTVFIHGHGHVLIGAAASP